MGESGALLILTLRLILPRENFFVSHGEIEAWGLRKKQKRSAAYSAHLGIWEQNVVLRIDIN